MAGKRGGEGGLSPNPNPREDCSPHRQTGTRGGREKGEGVYTFLTGRGRATLGGEDVGGGTEESPDVSFSVVRKKGRKEESALSSKRTSAWLRKKKIGTNREGKSVL